MIFTDFKTIKLQSAPTDNPPTGSIYLWETLDISNNLIINYKLHDGTVKTFTVEQSSGSSGSSSTGLTSVAVDGTTITGDGTALNPLVSHSSGITSIVVDGTSITGAGTVESPLASHSSGGGSSAGFDPNQAIFLR